MSHAAADLPGQRTPEEINLTDALNKLYAAAGHPSRRDLSRDMPGSHGNSTVGDALNGNGLPKWPVFEALVAHFGGSTAEFLTMYQEARLARDTRRREAHSATILLCTAPRHGTTIPVAIFVHGGESMCGECFGEGS
jgi:hypothetical protein